MVEGKLKFWSVKVTAEKLGDEMYKRVVKVVTEHVG